MTRWLSDCFAYVKKGRIKTLRNHSDAKGKRRRKAVESNREKKERREALEFDEQTPTNLLFLDAEAKVFFRCS